MTHRHIYEVTDNKIIINLPQEFKNKVKVLVTVDDKIETNTSKIILLQKAVSDPLFLADIKGINDDFNSVDKESL